MRIKIDSKYIFKSSNRLCSIFLICTILLFFNCFRVIRHDFSKAIKSTNEVLFRLFQKEYSEAFTQLHHYLLKEITFKEFQEGIEQVYFENYGGIREIVFDSYLPVFGQSAIQLYYTARYNSGKEISFHFVLFGDAKEGYKIRIFDVGNQIEYPPNAKYYGVKKINLGVEVIINPDTIIITPDSLRDMVEFEREEKL